nr:hypothetical protein CFP56_52881 [Quercus suber]
MRTLVLAVLTGASGKMQSAASGILQGTGSKQLMLYPPGSVSISDSSAFSNSSSVAGLPSVSLATTGPSLTSSVTTSAINAHDGFSTTELTYGPTEVLTLYECSSSGIVQASACSSSWLSWSIASADFVQAHGSVYTTTTAFPSPAPYMGYTSVLGRPESETAPYATCNGIPRYHGGWTSTGQVLLPSVTTNITIEILATSTSVAFNEPQPSCCIGSTDCFALQQEWHGLNQLLYPFNNTVSQWVNGQPIDYPHCETELEEIFGTTGAGDCSGCWISGENAHLYYWPQSVEEAPLCPDSYVLQSNTAIANNASRPVTAVLTYSNTDFYPNVTTTTTLTSPTIYLSVQNLQGRDGCHDFYGAPFPGTLFALGPKETQSALMTFPGMTDAAASSSFASIIAHQETEKYTDLFGIGYETLFQTRFKIYPIVTQLVDINMADLGRPPPYLSYFLGDAGAKCIQGNNVHEYFPCGTIFDKYVTPEVRLGTVVRSFRTQWASCNLDFGFDPPIALTPALSVAPFSFPSSESPMTPASTTLYTVESALASNTAMPQPTPEPKTAGITTSSSHTTMVSAHHGAQETVSTSTDPSLSLGNADDQDDSPAQSGEVEATIVLNPTTIPNASGVRVIAVTEVMPDGSSALTTLTLAPSLPIASQDQWTQTNEAGEALQSSSNVEISPTPADRGVAVTELAQDGATVTTTLTGAPLSAMDPGIKTGDSPVFVPDSQPTGNTPDEIYTLTEVGQNGALVTTTLSLGPAPAAGTPNSASQSIPAGDVTLATEIIQDGSTIFTTFTIVRPSTAPLQNPQDGNADTSTETAPQMSLAMDPSITTAPEISPTTTSASQEPSAVDNNATANRISTLCLALISAACLALLTV